MKRKKSLVDKFYPRKKVLTGYMDNFNFNSGYIGHKTILLYKFKRNFKVRIIISEL